MASTKPPPLEEEEWTGKGLLMKADVIADTFRDEVRSEVAKVSRPLKLVGILATTSAPSKSYAEFTQKMCSALGVQFEIRSVGSAKSEELGDGDGVEEAIIEANEDEGVDGIMVSGS
jgi:methylenetetrahydrofolate dehydrogenase (NAD+)